MKLLRPALTSVLLVCTLLDSALAAPPIALPRQLTVDVNGDVRVGARLYVYEAGTTTLRTAYATAALGTPLSNPVVADSAGLFPAIYVDPTAGNYKLVLKDSADVTLWSEDNLPAAAFTPAQVGAFACPISSIETGVGLTSADLDFRYCYGYSKRYKAAGDGVADDSVELQNGLNVAEAGLGFLHIQAGTYLVSTTLTVDSGDVMVFGDGPESVLKMANAANLNHVLYFNGATSATAHDFKVDGNKAHNTTSTFGALIESFNTPRTMFHALTSVESNTDGISIRNGGTGYIEGSHIENCDLTGSKLTAVKYARAVNNTYKNCQRAIGVEDAYASDVVIANNTVIGDHGITALYGFTVVTDRKGLEQSERVLINGNYIYGCGDATGSNGAGIAITGGTATRAEAEISVANNLLYENRDGLTITNSRGVSATANVIKKSDLRGISISGGADITLVANILSEHDNHAGSAHAIAIGTNATSGASDGVSVVANTIHNSTTANSPVGIYVQDSAQTNILTAFNQISGTTTPISPYTGTGGVIRSNRGYKTANGGTGTITTTSVTVTHGLAITPSAANIRVTFTEDPTDPIGTLWISNITSSQFTVNVEGDPGAGDLDFSWAVVD